MQCGLILGQTGRYGSRLAGCCRIEVTLEDTDVEEDRQVSVQALAKAVQIRLPT